MKEREKAEKLLHRVKKFMLCGIDGHGYPTAKAALAAYRRFIL